MVGRYKQLCNKSQQQILVGYMIYLLVGILLYEANNLICRRLYDRYSFTPLPYSGHLCCSADLWGQGKVRGFAGQVQHSQAFTAFQLAIS